MSYKKSFFIALFYLLNCLATVSANAVEEHKVKAAFLYNFANFVYWPDFIFVKPETPFFICILGSDPFKESLDFAVKNEKVEGHPILVQRIKVIKDISHCQILFISLSEADQLEQILSNAKRNPILTVSDIQGFACSGGMIEFYVQNSKIRFTINPNNAKQVGLHINANLLRVAKIAPDD